MLQRQRDEFRKENSQLRAKEIILLRARERLLSRMTKLESEKDSSKREQEALELQNLGLATLRNSASSSHSPTFALLLIFVLQLEDSIGDALSRLTLLAGDLRNTL